MRVGMYRQLFVLEVEQHKWRKGLSKEEMGKLLKFYEERYGQ